MTSNRWGLDDVAGLLLRNDPGGLVDLWNAVPPDYSVTASGLASLRSANQLAIVQRLASLEQKSIAAAGVGAGFRPEVFAAIQSLPGVDVILMAGMEAIGLQLDLGGAIDVAERVIAEVLDAVGLALGAGLAVVQLVPALGQVAAVVTAVVLAIVKNTQAWAAQEAASVLASLDCAPPAYSAMIDRESANAAVMLLTEPDWTRLFVPEGRPFDPEFIPWPQFPEGYGNDGRRGFTCCPSTVDGGRVIAPVGVGVGNRIQVIAQPIFYAADGLGFGCLPMCPSLQVHRAIIVTASGQTYDPGASFAELGGVGGYAWRMLWGGGPAAFAVDGDLIGRAWAEYLELLREFIRLNVRGFGTGQAPGGRVCDGWGGGTMNPNSKPNGPNPRWDAVDWFLEQLGEYEGQPTPIAAWKSFERYQDALLRRVGIAYVDARTCVSRWRSRVRQAQQELLSHATAVCELDLDAIPDPEYREAVDAERHRRGVSCWATAGNRVASRATTATNGPSLEPLDGDGGPLPEIPPFRARSSASTSGSGGGPPAKAGSSGTRGPTTGAQASAADDDTGMMMVGAAALMGGAFGLYLYTRGKNGHRRRTR